MRLLFCLFAEDTGIFKPEQLSHFIKCDSSPDGHDLAEKLASLFQTLNTPSERRLSILDESLAAFPYVNGGLFAESLPMAAFSAEMRKALLDCGALDWSKISPAIFGAMFQGVMDETAHLIPPRTSTATSWTPRTFILRDAQSRVGKLRPCSRWATCRLTAASLIRSHPLVMERAAKCREWGLASKSADTRKHTATPTLFREQKNPKTAIIIPKVSSEKRDYIPIGFIDDSTIVTNLAFIIPDATLYHFGILTSRMHNAWMRAVARRLEMRYRYSKDIVYNNFPWPALPAASAAPVEKLNVEKLKSSAGLSTPEPFSHSTTKPPNLSTFQLFNLSTPLRGGANGSRRQRGASKRDAGRPLRSAHDAAGLGEGPRAPRRAR